MDDLEQVATLLTKPEPSSELIGRGRDRLAEAIRTPARHRPGRPHHAGRRLARWNSAGWLAAGATLAAAAAATAVVLASGPVTPGGKVPTNTGPPSTGTRGSPAPAPAVARSPAQRILLAAAATALRQRPGTYWYFKVSIKPKGQPKPPPGVTVISTYESWIARDGKYWNATPPCTLPGTAVFEGQGYAAFYIGNVHVTYRVARRLPTSPPALTAWIARHNTPGVGGGATFVPETLISLLWQVPAPPAVRAAAFEALAAWPGVKSLGPVKGGVGLLIKLRHVPAADWPRLVVDPATALVRSEGDAKAITVIHTGWTNRLPKIVPLGGKTCPG